MRPVTPVTPEAIDAGHADPQQADSVPSPRRDAMVIRKRSGA